MFFLIVQEAGSSSLQPLDSQVIKGKAGVDGSVEPINKCQKSKLLVCEY